MSPPTNKRLPQRAVHNRLAQSFQTGVTTAIGEGANVPAHPARELAYQLKASGATDRLRETLSTMSVFLSLYDGDAKYEVMAYWSTEPDGSVIDQWYRRGLERWTESDGVERGAGIGRVADILERLRRWSYGMELCRERLHLAVARGDTVEEAASRRSLSGLLRLRGAHDEALEELACARDLLDQLGNRLSAAIAQGNLGDVYRSLGEYDRALEHFSTAAVAHRLGVMLEGAADDEQRAELHFWLWKLGDSDADHRSESERLYAALAARIPKHDYCVKLEELCAATSPSSPTAGENDAAA